MMQENFTDTLSGGIDLSEWLQGPEQRERLLAHRAWLREQTDRSMLERDDLAWARSAAVQYFFFGYDSAWIDPKTRRFNVDAFLDDGEENFGGYDMLILWQPYPRMGICERSQIDFYSDWPGGLDGLKDFIDRCNERGTRCVLNHVRWDQQRPHTWAKDMEAFGDLIQRVGADGFWGDTLNACPHEVRERLDSIGKGLAIECEYNFPLSAMKTQNATWSQGHDPTPLNPFIQTWVDPRAMIRFVNRGASDKTRFLSKALFWGTGYCVWENIFGWWNPFNARDRAFAQKVTSLLRAYHDFFTDLDWTPLDYQPADGVYGNRFSKDAATAVTLLNTTEEKRNGVRLKVPNADLSAWDVWNGVELKPATGEGDSVVLDIEPGNCGMVVFQPAAGGQPVFAPERRVHNPREDMQTRPCKDTPTSILVTGRKDGKVFEYERDAETIQSLVTDTDFRRRVGLEAFAPQPVAPSEKPFSETPPDEMCAVPGGRFTMSVTHMSRMLEGGCYGDPQSMTHPIQHFWVRPFAIDRTEVTQGEYARFLRASGYCPDDLTHFLDDWDKREGSNPTTWKPQSGRQHLPVVWVDLQDARAYAAWAGKRLPREEEWQIAAGGYEARVWPWGETFDPEKCNYQTDELTPVDAFPGGVSPFGAMDMAGNAWEWTESERHDGHTRFAILRGGSHLVRHEPDHPEAWGKMWYCAEGAQPNNAHQKMLLLWPGLDRCSTISFRCVCDSE
jgi:gamma-glutamyl hercynylcysteine S-oxide synthase